MACAATVISAEPGDQCRYHCVTGKLAAGKELPSDCWQKKYPTAATEILTALRPVAPNGAADQQRLREKLALAESIAELAEHENLTADNIDALYERFGAQAMGRFCAALPNGSEIELVFRNYRENASRNYQRAYRLSTRGSSARPLPQPHIVTSPEFLEAITQFATIYQARADRKIKFGNPYSKKAVTRVIREAKRFCAYLETDEIFRWADVGQRHIDGYLDVTNREAAQRAYAFLRFVTKRFRIRSTFKRPESKVVNVRARLVSMQKINEILDDARASTDTETMLALFLVALYGQTIAALSRLTTKQIREADLGDAIQFNETWVPLDKETSEVLHVHLSAMKNRLGQSEFNDQTRLFWSNESTLQQRIFNRTDTSLKNLRITALANILKTGFTDRHALEVSLGVSQPTIAMLERVCGWDVQSAVSDEAAQIRKDLIDGKLSDR